MSSEAPETIWVTGATARYYRMCGLAGDIQYRLASSVELEIAERDAEIERLQGEARTWLRNCGEASREGLRLAEELAAERQRVRLLEIAIKCERECHDCIMVHEPEREPCNAENCAVVAAVEQKP